MSAETKSHSEGQNMTTYNVSNVTEFNTTLKLAKAGDVIALASGQYDGIKIQNFDGGTGVTVTSADKDDRAVLSDLLVSKSSALTFSDLHLHATEDKYHHFTTFGSDNIHYDRIEVSGLDNIGSRNELTAFLLRDSTNISVTNSEFYHLFHGLSLLDTTNAVIKNNFFHDIRSDGIHGGGNNDLLIEKNIVTNLYAFDGDHPDAIQLWTTNTTEVAKNITVRDNLFFRGDGHVAQGVFVQDETKNLPFENVTITGNVILGGMYNGVTISGVDGGLVANNTVIGYEDMQSWVRVKLDQNLDVRDNIATAYVFDDMPNDPRLANNEKVDLKDVSIDSIVQKWVLDFSETADQWSDAFANFDFNAPRPNEVVALEALFEKTPYDPSEKGQKEQSASVEKISVEDNSKVDPDGFIAEILLPSVTVESYAALMHMEDYMVTSNVSEKLEVNSLNYSQSKSAETGFHAYQVDEVNNQTKIFDGFSGHDFIV